MKDQSIMSGVGLLRGSTLVIVTGLCLILIGLPVGVSSAAQQALSDPYTVHGIKVDITAESAAAARDLAITEGQRQAFARLMKRLVLRSDQKNLLVPSDLQIQGMLATLQVENEKTSPTRYIATMVLRFQLSRVRKFLREAGVVFSETPSKPRLVLPVFETGGVQVLWDKPNPWWEVWSDFVSRPYAVVPLFLPEGSLPDVAAVSAGQALLGKEDHLLRLASRYGLDDVLVAHAVLVQDLKTRIPRLHVTLHQFGPAGDDTVIQSFTGTVKKDIPELLRSGTKNSMQRMEDDWKSSNRLDFHRPARLSVRVSIPDITYWLAVQKRLARAAIVDRTEITQITRTDAQIILHYFGDPKQLSFALLQRNLNLRQDQGFWNLETIGAEDD